MICENNPSSQVDSGLRAGISLYSHHYPVIAGLTRNLLLLSQIPYYGGPDPCHAGLDPVNFSK